MSVPAEIPGIGSTAQKLRVSPSFDPMRAGVGPEEYFVMSRIDGTTSLRDVIVTTGLPLGQAISIISKLRTLGALLLPGELPRQASASIPPAAALPATGSGSFTPPPRAATMPPPAAAAASANRAYSSTPPLGYPRRAATEPGRMRASGELRSDSSPSIIPPPAAAFGAPAPQRSARASTEPGRTRGDERLSERPPERNERTDRPEPAAVIPIALDTSLPDPSDLELAVLAAELEVAEPERRTILAMARRIGADPWTILGVVKGSDPGALKKVYFRLSKEVHPDRYYGKRLGPLAPILTNVFESVSRAYTTLTEAKKQRDRAPSNASSPQAPADHAIELFDRGCAAEVSGDLAGALQLFAASLRVDPQLRVFRRGASCALAAKQPKLALEYAKKAQTLASEDPSNARLLARAFRANGELPAAEEVLVFALALPIDNDSLMAELRADLVVVRKQLTQA